MRYSVLPEDFSLLFMMRSDRIGKSIWICTLLNKTVSKRAANI